MEYKSFRIEDLAGNAVPGATVNVYLTGTTTHATGLEDFDGGAVTSPFTADAVTGKVGFRAPNGTYDIVMVRGDFQDALYATEFFDIDDANIDRSGRYDSVQALLDSTDPARGEGKVWQGGARLFTEAAVGAFDYHEITAGGVGLYEAGDRFTTRERAESGDTLGSDVIYIGDLAFGLDPSGTALTTGDGRTRSPAGGVSVKHFGAVGDGVADDTDAINAALAFADHVYLQEGTYAVTSLSNFGPTKRLSGPGLIKASATFQTDDFGDLVAAGVKRGNTFPLFEHGGFLIGGGGETPHGVLLKSQGDGIADIIPTRDGNPLEFQIYSNAVQGYGDFTGTTFDAVVRSHSFSEHLYANDRIWFGPTLYRIDSITDVDTLTIKNEDGTAASTPSDLTQPFWSMYHHAEHTADLVGGLLTVISGDEVQDWGEDHNVVINGARYEVSAIDTVAGTYTLSAPPADANGLNVLHRFVSGEDYVSLFRWQTLRGQGKEMTFSRGVRPDMAYDRIGATGSGADNYAYYLPFHFLTGRSSEKEQISGEDNMEGEGFTALTIGGQGQHIGKIGIGKRLPTRPLDLRWNYFNAGLADNTTKEVSAFGAMWQGANERRLAVLQRNNTFGSGLQAYAGSGTSTTDMALQPTGGGVNIGSWDTPDTGMMFQVRGATKLAAEIHSTLLPAYADDPAASAGGVAVGQWYHSTTSGAIRQRRT